jgi:ClpX C4-type zinc finger
MTVADELRSDVACTFCMKPTADVTWMISGPGVFICDLCVALCVQILESKPQGMPEVARWERDLSDEDLLAHLPRVAAVGAQADRQLAGWVRTARSRGITWTRIGAALGMTRQSAWERFSGED